MNNQWGIPVVLNPFLIEWKQYRFPRSKKKRIRAKWAKRQENYRMVPVYDVIWLSSGKLMMHPETYKAIIQTQRDHERNRKSMHPHRTTAP